ncbi:MAG: hypothetical protein ACI8PT_004134 [Gammaproteobacteria bacterium]|jgi:hypothetical protein
MTGTIASTLTLSRMRSIPFVWDDATGCSAAPSPVLNQAPGLYSSIETARVIGLDPYGHLRKVFAYLPNAKTVEDIEASLPSAADPIPSIPKRLTRLTLARARVEYHCVVSQTVMFHLAIDCHCIIFAL